MCKHFSGPVKGQDKNIELRHEIKRSLYSILIIYGAGPKLHLMELIQDLI